MILTYLSFASAVEGDFASARAYVASALQSALALGHDERATWCMQTRGLIEQFAGNADAALQYATDALEAFRGLDLSAQTARTLTDVSACLICLGRYDEAEQSAREALTLAYDFQLPFSVGRAFRHLAMIAAFRQGEPQRRAQVSMNAARIIGFVEARFATVRTTWSWFNSPERQEYERAKATLCDELGDAFANHMADGASLTEEEIVEEALSR